MSRAFPRAPRVAPATVAAIKPNRSNLSSLFQIGSGCRKVFARKIRVLMVPETCLSRELQLHIDEGMVRIQHGASIPRTVM
eukprot:scaffold217332_cov42-Prasinocladus_malaysianus.AAC.1